MYSTQMNIFKYFMGFNLTKVILLIDHMTVREDEKNRMCTCVIKTKYKMKCSN